MLLQQLIRQPTTSSNMLVFDPFRPLERAALVKEVIGLANAEVEGPRYIIFGVNPGAMEGKRVVGINDDAMADLKKAHRLVSSLVEPFVQLAFIFDRIENRLVGALEVDGCEEGPYKVAENPSQELPTGSAWIRDGRELREVNTAELVAAPEPVVEEEEPDELIEPPPMRLGFGDDLSCDVIGLDILDSSNPPFVEEMEKVNRPMDLKQTIKDSVSEMTSQMLSLARGGKTKDSEGSSNGAGEHTAILQQSESLFDAAQNHYYFEEKALQFNLTVSNDGEQTLKGATIELGMPKFPDFDVADRIYVSPFDKRSQHAKGNRSYPKVDRRLEGILVRGNLEDLEPGAPTQVFDNALRLAVGPGMRRKKVGILYTIRARNEQILAEGRLKIQFGGEIVDA